MWRMECISFKICFYILNSKQSYKCINRMMVCIYFFVFGLETFFWSSKIVSKIKCVGVGYKFGTLR